MKAADGSRNVEASEQSFTTKMAGTVPQTAFQPGTAAIPSTRVEVSVSCRKLQDRDVLSKSDPICVLFTKSFAKDNYVEFGRTEMIKDTLNPDFVKKFLMDYYFEESQKLKFEIYDIDSASSKLTRQDFLGSMQCTLGEIVGAANNKLERNLSEHSAKNCGIIVVRAEELATCKEQITLQFDGQKLDKKDFFGKSDPYLVISRSNEDSSFTVVHQTEVIKNTLNPTWRPFLISVQALCNGDYDRSIKFDCYDWDSDGGSHDFIGSFCTTTKQLSRGPDSSNECELINPKKKAKKRNYMNSGKIRLLNCKVEPQHTFLDYIQGGMDLSFTVAIDFTASNGNPTSSTSLHYYTPQQQSMYAHCLLSVGGIIQDYDSDKMFPALGFGAKIPPNGAVSHEFFLNGSTDNPYCQGIAGVMDAYYKSLQHVQLYGPTNFAPVINHVAKFAQAYRDGSHYFVLLILTDGIITDMPMTKQAIIDASRFPMSIIIVGIGNEDFSAMRELDSDDKMLTCRGHSAERDIVQFVPFREFIGGRYGNDLATSQAYLAKEVLAEIPGQITGYMKKHGISPRSPT
ncbi:Copine-8 [Lamellibrachia satsuma]|nr:Copine-8 [Lamellibrachia satsuma]